MTKLIHMTTLAPHPEPARAVRAMRAYGTRQYRAVAGPVQIPELGSRHTWLPGGHAGEKAQLTIATESRACRWAQLTDETGGADYASERAEG